MSQAIDLQTTSAVALREALRRREVSAVELCRASIDRIERFDDAINAVVVRDFERALDDAAVADIALAAGDERPLLGVPATVKESFDLAGYPKTWGFEFAKDNIATSDARIVVKLREAGAIILGKTNVPPALADWQSANPIYGRTSNPHNLDRSPGGSSGGAAAALAAGFSALEVGTDIGGSVRIPAAFCGVFGLKTTYNSLPMAGHAPPGSGVGKSPPLSVVGPLARTAEDAALLTKVLAELDPMLPATGLELPTPRALRLPDFRVLVIAEHPKAEANEAVLNALQDVAHDLERAGANVARKSVLLPDLLKLHRAYQKMLQSVISRRAPTQRSVISAHDYMELEDEQVRVRMQWAELFRSFDIVLMPTFGTGAFAHTDEEDWAKRPFSINGRDSRFGDQMGWISSATFANLPATAFPAGVDSDGMPISLQAIGPHLGDLTTLQFAGLAARPVAPAKLG